MDALPIRPFEEKTPNIAKGVYIDSHALVIGDVTLGEDCSVWPMSVIRGDVNSITIGQCTNIQDGSILHVTHDGPFTPGGFPLIIGDGVTIGHKAMLHACTIEDYCLIGMNAIILDGAHIEPYCIIGAGSLIPPKKRLESGYLYVGTPAKKTRPLSPKDKEMLEYSAQHYKRLKDKYLAT
jgi:carbonic anhydrase/acetyltransferase-like protein (isoleucine patch superfamily)